MADAGVFCSTASGSTYCLCMATALYGYSDDYLYLANHSSGHTSDTAFAVADILYAEAWVYEYQWEQWGNSS
jgi:hypothetical protein